MLLSVAKTDSTNLSELNPPVLSTPSLSTPSTSANINVSEKGQYLAHQTTDTLNHESQRTYHERGAVCSQPKSTTSETPLRDDSEYQAKLQALKRTCLNEVIDRIEDVAERLDKYAFDKMPPLSVIELAAEMPPSHILVRASSMNEATNKEIQNDDRKVYFINFIKKMSEMDASYSLLDLIILYAKDQCYDGANSVAAFLKKMEASKAEELALQGLNLETTAHDVNGQKVKQKPAPICDQLKGILSHNKYNETDLNDIKIQSITPAEIRGLAETIENVELFIFAFQFQPATKKEILGQTNFQQQGVALLSKQQRVNPFFTVLELMNVVCISGQYEFLQAILDFVNAKLK